jgi:hypothetical protein
MNKPIETSQNVKPKHTPGPWQWHRVDETTWKVISQDYGTVVNINQYPDALVMPDEQCEATAALISASPEMYDACKLALSAMECNPKFRENAPTIEALKAAIAKAEGGVA